MQSFAACKSAWPDQTAPPEAEAPYDAAANAAVYVLCGDVK